jgi:hypothetical protein
MGAWYFRDRVRLANDKEVLDLADVILRFALYGAPIYGIIRQVMQRRNYELDNEEVS